VLKLRIELSRSAVVKSRLLGANGRLLKRGVLGTLDAGANTVRIRLPRGLAKGTYRLMLDASGEGRSAHTFVRVRVA